MEIRLLNKITFAALLLGFSFKTLASAEFCKPNKLTESKVKQVVIVPGTGGQSPIDSTLLKSLCNLGFKTAIVEANLNYLKFDSDYGVHDRWVNQFITQLKITLDANSEPTAIIGSSLGGIFTSIAYSKNRELFNGNLKGMITVVAGGPLATVIETSVLPQLTYLNLQREIFTYRNLNDEQRHNELIRNITLDPVKLAQPQLSNKVMMFLADYDVVVPSVTQMALWNSWGQPRVTHVFAEHIGTITWVYTRKAKEIGSFIDELE